jgi:hypothetical protein
MIRMTHLSQNFFVLSVLCFHVCVAKGSVALASFVGENANDNDSDSDSYSDT